MGMVVLLAGAGGAAWWWRGAEAREVAGGAGVRSFAGARGEAGTPGLGREVPGPLADARSHGEVKALTAEEKAAQVARIKRDYDEVRTKVAAEYTAAGGKFPGGLNAFLRQLALLEREKRKDYAALLSPRELEDVEYRETTAGQLVQRLLGGTAATEEQRRAAFRLQLEFDDRFALIFDLSAPALLERETARQQVQEKIRGVLGDELFAAWLKGEGADFERFQKFVAEQRLAKTQAYELWELKNEYVRRRLELNTQRLPPEQLKGLKDGLTRETQARVVGVLGPGAAEVAKSEVLGWLPAK